MLNNFLFHDNVILNVNDFVYEVYYGKDLLFHIKKYLIDKVTFISKEENFKEYCQNPYREIHFIFEDTYIYHLNNNKTIKGKDIDIFAILNDVAYFSSCDNAIKYIKKYINEKIKQQKEHVQYYQAELKFWENKLKAYNK